MWRSAVVSMVVFLGCACQAQPQDASASFLGRDQHADRESALVALEVGASSSGPAFAKDMEEAWLSGNANKASWASDPLVRVALAGHLSKLHPQRKQPYLALLDEASQSAEAELAWSAAGALGNVPGREVLERLFKLAMDARPGVAKMAQDSLQFRRDLAAGDRGLHSEAEYMAQSCARPAVKRELSEFCSSLGPTPGMPLVRLGAFCDEKALETAEECRSRGSLEFTPGSVHVRATREGGGALKLQCRDPGEISAFEAKLRGQRIGLFAGGGMIADLDSGFLRGWSSEDCGLIPMADRESAVHACAVIAYSWGLRSELCGRAAAGSDARLSVICHASREDDPRLPCTPASLGFQDRFVHVLGTQDSRFALQLRCLEPDAQRAFYDAAGGQRVGLFAGDERLQEFGVPSVAGRTLPECGFVAMPDLDATLAACEALAKSWDMDPAQCTTLCPAPGPNDEPICVEHY